MSARIEVGVALIGLLACGAAGAEPLWADEAANLVLQGWSTDSRFVVYQRNASFIDDPTGDEGESCTLVTQVVLDGASGERQEFLESMEGTCDRTRPKAARLGKAEAFKAWQDGHPLTLLQGESSPDKRSRAVISVKAGEGFQARGAWEQGLFRWGPKDESDILMQAELGLFTEGGGKRWKVASHSEASAGNLQGEVTVAWSPDGKRAAWVLHRGYAMMNDFGFARLAVTPAAGPRIELLGAKKVLAAARAKVEGALAKGGLVIVRAGEAVKERPKSVVYAAKGLEDVGGQVAALVPGGAAVEALTWRAFGDVVIALGDSAAVP
ncbi:MAG TPA: hypothetical protein PK668_02365 [Myxococcota bacterium]|nr:hypothetical protein [Myxococcota bacterium]HRY94587.1 hypothetical protein [Myxococcota bacterium]HSA20331.1 hypothetical protein [Myxococcota bacterium]